MRFSGVSPNFPNAWDYDGRYKVFKKEVARWKRGQNRSLKITLSNYYKKL